MDYRRYGVSRRHREPLLQFMLEALRSSGCRILDHSLPIEAPFRISFETPEGERIGILAYAFLANSKRTKNRPSDEHRFQLKYGAKDGESQELWQDPFGLYTTLLVGIDPERGFFVGADPVLHSPTLFFISLFFKRHHVEAILREGWHVWERDSKAEPDEPVEVLVGGRPEHFLSYVRFEREALGEDQGHRQLLAERALRRRTSIHALTQELELTEREVFDVIDQARMLKVAVRGAVAEEHLLRRLRALPEVESCERLVADGPDLRVRLSGGPEVSIECKNVLRARSSAGLARLDFQRTRAAKSDPCSRYYSPRDFEVVAACLHAVTETWEFRFALSRNFAPHALCEGKLASNVSVDERWSADPLTILRAASVFRT